jgi:signal peptidase I
MGRAPLFSGLFAVSLPMSAVDGIDRLSAKEAWPHLATSAQAMQLATARHLAALVGGRMARIAGTGSMEPQLTGWDLAIFVGLDAAEPHRGDIVIYRVDSPLSRLFGMRETGLFICHRIVGTHMDGSFETMGDANPTPDSSHVRRSQILGVVRYAVDGRTGAVRDFVAPSLLSRPHSTEIEGAA